MDAAVGAAAQNDKKADFHDGGVNMSDAIDQGISAWMKKHNI